MELDNTLMQISIHAPREGSDAVSCSSAHLNPWKFLSTLPARGATKARPRVEIEIIISIHAPREGSDQTFVSASRNSVLDNRKKDQPGLVLYCYSKQLRM